MIKSSGFTTSSANGKLLNEQAYDATYDGKNALIKTLDNGKFKEFVLDKKDINEILAPFFRNKFNNNNELLLKRLGNQYDIIVEPKEYYNNLKSVDSELKDLFIDISKIKKKTIKQKKRKNNKNNKKNKTNKKK